MKILIGSSYVFRLLSWAYISKTVINSSTFKLFLPFWGRYYSNIINHLVISLGNYVKQNVQKKDHLKLIKQGRFLVSSGIMLA